MVDFYNNSFKIIMISILLNMPRISFFLGISIYMYYDDHNPPHFHAIYNEYATKVDIKTGNITLKGKA